MCLFVFLFLKGPINFWLHSEMYANPLFLSCTHTHTHLFQIVLENFETLSNFIKLMIAERNINLCECVVYIYPFSLHTDVQESCLTCARLKTTTMVAGVPRWRMGKFTMHARMAYLLISSALAKDCFSQGILGKLLMMHIILCLLCCKTMTYVLFFQLLYSPTCNADSDTNPVNLLLKNVACCF